MKLFIQDHSWAGATIVVANTSEEAAQIARGANSYYEPSKPWDVERELTPGETFHYEVFGDR